MTPTETPPIAAPPDHPVRVALADPALREELTRHALSVLTRRLAGRPQALRVEEAEEIVQKTIERALKVHAGYDPNAGKTVAGWIHGILEKVCLEHCRKLDKQPAQPSSDPKAWDDVAAPMNPDSELVELQKLLDRLSERSRQLVTWYHLDGTPHEEMAQRLGISAGCCRTRLARALAELRQLAKSTEGTR